MNRVLITGGAGFLGSHLCDRLMKAGDDVLCVDNYFTGSKANIAHLIGLEVRSYHHLLGR
jgi:UDP-glucuronate decarboxylase